MLAAFLEQVDNKILYEQAVCAQATSNQADALSLEDLMKKYGLDPADIEAVIENVEIE